jgi:RNA polymerase sigma factor (sigma-70 family)
MSGRLSKHPEDWAAELMSGRVERAWDLFLTRYRRLIFATIRHYARDYDDEMDVFARVCESLREGQLKRLREYAEQQEHRARFSTWLVVMTRNLTIDWFRERDGRRRVSPMVNSLPHLQRCVFERVFIERRTHLEAYELIRSRDVPELSFHEYLVALRATFQKLSDSKRGQMFRELSLSALADPPPDELSAVDLLGLREVVEPVLATLTPEDRAAVELYVVEGLPAQQVAALVGFPNAKTVYNRVHRALAALRSRLEATGARREDLL